MNIEEFIPRAIEYFSTESWIIQVFTVVFITLLLNFFQFRVSSALLVHLKKTNSFWDDALLASAQKPVGLLIWIVGLAFAATIVQKQTDAAIFSAIDPIRDIGVIFCLAWFLVRFVANAETSYIEKKQLLGQPYDRTTADAIAKLLRISIIITSILVALQTMGYSISGVLAFGGIGGIAIGFAAKDLLANFFGGLMIYLDRPFEVGNWINSPDKDIEGVVENIGWRLTTIRTFDKRPMYIPNSIFANISVCNPSRMSHRRIKETIGIRYDDASKMADIVSEVKSMLQNHPGVDTDQALIVNFDAFAPYSLDFFIYCLTKTTNWFEYHDVKQDVMLKIINIIEDHEAECAFPTSTLHVPEGIAMQEMAAREQTTSGS